MVRLNKATKQQYEQEIRKTIIKLKKGHSQEILKIITINFFKPINLLKIVQQKNIGESVGELFKNLSTQSFQKGGQARVGPT